LPPPAARPEGGACGIARNRFAPQSRIAPPSLRGDRDFAGLRLARHLLSAGAMKTLTLIAVLFLATPALAQSYVSRGMSGFPGKDELSAQLGFQASMGGGTPNGFKMFFDYSHRLSQLVWLNFKLNPTFGAGGDRTICTDGNGNVYDCTTGFAGEGWALDILAGVKLKWMTRVHVMPYANIDAGVVPIFSRPNEDTGAAVVIHTGGGVKYFVTPRIGLGGEIDFTLGPAFYGSSRYVHSHNEFYRAFNFVVGAEFIL
jgi:hypothetical protein